LLTTVIACLQDQSKGGFLEGRLFSSQVEKKSRPSKKTLLFWSCKQAICLFSYSSNVRL